MVRHEEVRTFIGIDAHAGHCTLQAISRQGKCLRAVEVPTEPRALREAVRDLPAPVWAMLEAGSVAPRVKWALEGVVDRVIVCETRENRWIAKSEDKSDPADAHRLARLLRMGEFREVHVPKRERQELREVVLLYDKAVRDTTRARNRLKAKFRQHGVPVEWRAVYSAEGREAWLSKLRRPTIRFLGEVLYRKLDAAEGAQEALSRRLVGMLGHRREYRRTEGIPGMGPVTSSIFVAVVDDPRRFAEKRKLWRYAGLSVLSSWSSDPAQARKGGAYTGNRLLKYAAMTAAEAAVRGENRFARHHAEMLRQGVEPAMALKTTARNILATALAMWKSGTEYRDAP